MGASRSTTCTTAMATPTSVRSRRRFPYARKPGRAGSGQLSCTSYTVPNGATTFWKEHFERARRRAQRHPGAVRHEVPARAASGRAALRDDRGSEGPAQSVDDETGQPRRRDARLLRRRAVGARRARSGIVLRRRARLPEGRRGRSVSSVRGSGHRPRTHRRSARTNRTARPEAGASAPGPRITSPSMSRPTRRS